MLTKAEQGEVGEVEGLEGGNRAQEVVVKVATVVKRKPIHFWTRASRSTRSA